MTKQKGVSMPQSKKARRLAALDRRRDELQVLEGTTGVLDPSRYKNHRDIEAKKEAARQDILNLETKLWPKKG